MGRPLGKRFFGTGPGDQLAIRAKIGSSAEGNGYIVEQTGSSRYIVTVGADTGVVYLVDKANGALAAGEATITLVDSAAAQKRAKKLLRHRAVFFDGTSAPWSFDAATGIYYQVADETDGFGATITIGTQPASATVATGAPASFTVAATRAPAVGTLTYAWQLSTNGGTSYAPISNGGVYSGATSATLAISDATGLTGNRYRVVVGLTGADAAPVTSSAAILTVTP